MGVISPYKTFTFDGESSADYGVYLTGEGVFNAPERSVEMVEIPGRNGNFALDKGRFENISVTYRVGMFDDDEENFADKVSAFRNWLCSKVGYVRLTDDYNPNEYRMAVYLSGLELEHDFLIAGEAQITFDCKPQRWLTSGETAVSVADGGTLDNPTLFESEPLLAVEGYGNIAFNGYSIDLENAVLGDVDIAPQKTFTTKDGSISFDTSILNNGDDIYSQGLELKFSIKLAVASTLVSDVTISSVTDSDGTFASIFNRVQTTRTDVTTICNSFSYNKGTPSTLTDTVTVSGSATYSTQSAPLTPITVSFTITCTISITANDNGISVTRTYTNNKSTIVTAAGETVTSTIKSVSGYSTTSLLGNPTFVDCELGECYKIVNDEYISLNAKIALGSDLPKLVSGTNTINYDNTITDFKVTPRWWKV